MKLNKRERARPNVAGLTSRAQLAEMELLLAGRWPALKPLPVFRYETEEYRATIHFDKMRGEWVCRKTTLVPDKTQEVRKDLELRGGLTEMTMALPHGQAEATNEAEAADTRELDSADKLHIEAVRAWKEHYGNGAVYSGLQDYLSEIQQEEIYEIIRMTLTASQLQFNPKSIAFIFDVLSNSGGRLATLIELGRRKKAEAESRHEEIFPAVNADAKNANSSDEVKLQQGLLSLAASSHSDIGEPVAHPVAEILSAEFLQRIGDGVASEPAKNFAREPIHIDLSELDEGLTPDHVETNRPTGPECVAAEPIANLSAEHVEAPVPGRIAQSRPRASEIAAAEVSGANGWSFLESFRNKTPNDIPLFGFREFRMRGVTSKAESSPGSIEESTLPLLVPEKSAKKGVGLRIAAIVFLVVGFSVGFTVGLNTPAVPPETEESSSEKPSPIARPAVSATPSSNPSPNPSAIPDKPLTASSAVASTSQIDAARPASAPKRDDTKSEGEKSRERARESEAFWKAPSRDSSVSPAIEPDQTANREARASHDGSSGLVARNASPPVVAEPVHTGAASGTFRSTSRSTSGSTSRGEAGSTTRGTTRVATRVTTRSTTKATTKRTTISTKRGASRVAAASRVAPAPRAAPHAPSSPAILVTAPAQGSRPLKLTFAEKPIAVSSSFAITSQLSVLVAPEPGPATAHHPARLQAGKLVSYVWPSYPKPGNREESAETVKVRATIGKLGQVTDIKRVNGSSALLAAAESAIRQWHFQPTLLNERPVQTQQDVTIEFRPPRYLTQVSTRRSSPN